MSQDADLKYALELHKLLNGQSYSDDSELPETDLKPPVIAKKTVPIKRSNPRSNLDEEFLNRTQNLVHPLWETLDPTPDIGSLFRAFDGKFFQKRLNCVTLEWSKRMYSCAGICYSRGNRLGMQITIRLSEPLLKLRPRKDLIETLLHEMIHAYCFVLNIREGNGGHGPNFKKIMHGINKVAGTNITVYHTFHDEVNLYKQHWWRCNGSCQNRSPFFGYVKRTSNRAPSANDQWWAAHQNSCGGMFLKIKGPDKPQKAKKTKSATGTDLRKFFPTTKKENNTSGVANKNSGEFKGNTKTPKATATQSIGNAFPPTSYPGLSSDPFDSSLSGSGAKKPSFGGNLKNVKSLRDLNTESDSGNAGRAILNTKPASTMTGKGYSMNSDGSANRDIPSNSNEQVDRNIVRDVWSQLFGDSGAAKPNGGRNVESVNLTSLHSSGTAVILDDAKRPRLSSDVAPGASARDGKAEKSKSHWVVLDDDIMVNDSPVDVIAISSGDEDDEYETAVKSLVPRFKQHNMTAQERQTVIKQEILAETIDLCDEDITLIDDDYDDSVDDDDLSVASDLGNTSVIDEFFGDDSLLRDFKRENDVVPCTSRHVHDAQDDIITCPICQERMKRSVMEEHLDGCTGIAIKILPTFKKPSGASFKVGAKRPSSNRKRIVDILRKSGCSEVDIRNMEISSSDTESDNALLSSSPINSSPQQIDNESAERNDDWGQYGQQFNNSLDTWQCPVCALKIEKNKMNDHLDECLSDC